MNLYRAYSEEEVDTILWVSKRFDYLCIFLCVIALLMKMLLPESAIWKVFFAIALPFGVWSRWATISADSNSRIFSPFLSELTQLRLKRQANINKL